MSDSNDFLMSDGPPAPDPMDVLMAEDRPSNGLDKLYKNKRYYLPDPVTGLLRTWTRVTTMAETTSDLYALNLWRIRMMIIGLTRNPELLDELRELDEFDPETGKGKLDPKLHKDKLNKIGFRSQDLAGAKVPAGWGTRMHTWIEKLSRDEITLSEVEDKYRDEVTAWHAAMQGAELSAVPHLIERRVSIPVYGTAGTLDQIDRVHRSRSIRLGNRVVRLNAGDHLVGDVKGLALTERIPTPDGWATMGELRTGDQVFDAYGTPCNVTEKSPVKRIGTYIVRFDDGSSVVCDREHIWWTAAGFGTNVRPPFKPTAKPVSEIISTLRNSNGAQHRVPVAGPLDLPESDLPIDPYLLGCWLGDGAVRGGTIHKGRDLFEILEADGHSLGVEQDDKSDHCVARTVIGLTTQLRAAGLLHNKHIPAYYLRASAGQRVRLLQGLMDTDGTWNTARNSAAFSTTDKALAGQVEELMLSLGQRPHVSYMKRHGYGLTVDSWTVEITPVDLNPFRLPRKADQAAASVKSVTRSRRRVITQVLPGPDVDTACIAVDSPTHTYLCGDRMIPTHNSGRDLDYGWGEISIQMALYAHGAREGLVARWDPDAETADPDDPGAWVWEDIGIPPKSIRQDVGVVMHVPIGEKTCTLHWIDLTEGWKAVQLCDNVRDWRKAKGLQTPFSIAEVPTDDPGSSPRVRASSWQERFASITSRPHATLLYREYLRAGGVHGSPEANRLIAIATKHLEQLEESSA